MSIVSLIETCGGFLPSAARSEVRVIFSDPAVYWLDVNLATKAASAKVSGSEDRAMNCETATSLPPLDRLQGPSSPGPMGAI
ncbi:hypothetical protein N7539_006225 [Penicillium diatomitis]|uniref:Uncharacterized protein n=1 Tax=Penicillium diatomitis TaxID=2819901 RepID=A0A9W9X3W4_9EURO|nr:uncharacterized protein N7539_006225 [Penicillium diatomitis]KAJ5482779.1 hypothetical protein N7539_006225 [Penicillium diatomitis]